MIGTARFLGSRPPVAPWGRRPPRPHAQGENPLVVGLTPVLVPVAGRRPDQQRNHHAGEYPAEGQVVDRVGHRVRELVGVPQVVQADRDGQNQGAQEPGRPGCERADRHDPAGRRDAGSGGFLASPAGSGPPRGGATSRGQVRHGQGAGRQRSGRIGQHRAGGVRTGQLRAGRVGLGQVRPGRPGAENARAIGHRTVRRPGPGVRDVRGLRRAGGPGPAPRGPWGAAVFAVRHARVGVAGRDAVVVWLRDAVVRRPAGRRRSTGRACLAGGAVSGRLSRLGPGRSHPRPPSERHRRRPHRTRLGQ